MRKRSSDLPPHQGDDWSDLRARIIGFGERSMRKSYYPELRRRLNELERFRALLDRASGIIIVFDTDSGYVVDVNEAACRLLDLTRSEVLGRSMAELEPEALDRARRETASDMPFETHLTGAKDSGVSFEATISHLRVQGSRFAAFVAHDITERLHREDALRQGEQQLREIGRRKDEFLAMLGHELRNPLAPILTAAHLLGHLRPDDPQWPRSVELIERQTQHMARLIDDLLEMSRVVSGKINLRFEPLDLATLVATTVEDHRNRLEEAHLRLELRQAERPILVTADPVRLAQIIGNLLQNAIKFTDAGGEVSVTVAETPEETAEVTVSDTGIGMDSSTIDHVFEPFTQADRSLDRARGGLGLGLALARRLAEMHGGTLHAASRGPGRGSTFTVRLPRLRDQTIARSAASQAPARRECRRVLVVEDNTDAALCLAVFLEMHGHVVETVADGPAALAAARRQPPDLVLCDIGLPGMDGYEVARAMRADPALAKVRLVAITGYGQQDDRRRALEAGFDDHLTKPVPPEVMARIISDG